MYFAEIVSGVIAFAHDYDTVLYLGGETEHRGGRKIRLWASLYAVSDWHYKLDAVSVVSIVNNLFVLCGKTCCVTVDKIWECIGGDAFYRFLVSVGFVYLVHNFLFLKVICSCSVKFYFIFVKFYSRSAAKFYDEAVAVSPYDCSSVVASPRCKEFALSAILAEVCVLCLCVVHIVFSLVDSIFSLSSGRFGRCNPVFQGITREAVRKAIKQARRAERGLAFACRIQTLPKKTDAPCTVICYSRKTGRQKSENGEPSKIKKGKNELMGRGRIRRICHKDTDFMGEFGMGCKS